MKESKYR